LRAVSPVASSSCSARSAEPSAAHRGEHLSCAVPAAVRGRGPRPAGVRRAQPLAPYRRWERAKLRRGRGCGPSRSIALPIEAFGALTGPLSAALRERASIPSGPVGARWCGVPSPRAAGGRLPRGRPPAPGGPPRMSFDQPPGNGSSSGWFRGGGPGWAAPAASKRRAVCPTPPGLRSRDGRGPTDPGDGNPPRGRTVPLGSAPDRARRPAGPEGTGPPRWARRGVQVTAPSLNGSAAATTARGSLHVGNALDPPAQRAATIPEECHSGPGGLVELNRGGPPGAGEGRPPRETPSSGSRRRLAPAAPTGRWGSRPAPRALLERRWRPPKRPLSAGDRPARPPPPRVPRPSSARSHLLVGASGCGRGETPPPRDAANSAHRRNERWFATDGAEGFRGARRTRSLLQRARPPANAPVDTSSQAHRPGGPSRPLCPVTPLQNPGKNRRRRLVS